MNSRLYLFLLGLLLSLPLNAAAAQDQGADEAQDDADPYWRQFDERYPEIAGRGEELWQKAGELAVVRLGSRDAKGFDAKRSLFFQALSVHERDLALGHKHADTPEERAWIKARQEAAVRFEQNAALISAIRKKPTAELDEEDINRLVDAVVDVMKYIYDAQIESYESYFEGVVEENESLREQGSAEAEADDKTETDSPGTATTEPGKNNRETGQDAPGSLREALGSEYRAYLNADRIRIDSDDDGRFRNRDNDKTYDRSHVQVVGAIKNTSDKATRFSFKVVALRSRDRPIGLATVDTPPLQPGEVYEVDVTVPVENSAYLRGVDLRNVQASP